MFANFSGKILAGAVALALGAPAMATSIDAVGTGDLFVNVVDTTNQSSFLFDTGIAQASFVGSSSYNIDFSKDVNYQAFIAAKGASDVLDYSVFSATKTSTTPAVGTVLFTSNSSPSTVPGANISQAQAKTVGFLTQANLVASTTANSALLPSASYWGSTNAEQAIATSLGVVYTQPGTGIDALVGTALNFYNETSNALRSSSTQATLTTYAGTWNYNNGVATYGGGGSSVPLPTPVLLLLSGLGLMGAVARRGKGNPAV